MTPKAPRVANIAEATKTAVAERRRVAQSPRDKLGKGVARRHVSRDGLEGKKKRGIACCPDDRAL